MNFPIHFIRATKEFNTFEKHVPAPYFRKIFSVDKDIKAKVLISACGFYELYINGERKTKGFLAPYISNPNDIVYYDEYEVELKKGKNLVAVLLGNGFQNNPGGYIWDFDKADFRGAPCFAVSITADDKTILESDESFKTVSSPIVFDDYRFGEHYDARLEISGWNTLDFDDSSWKNAITAPIPKGEKRICEAEPIVAVKELKPISVTESENGFIYDFGINSAGICRLSVKGEKGQKIEISHAEQLIDGKPDLKSVWFDRELWERDKEIVHKDIYICKGEGVESYTPTFTYHGFRYVEVKGIKSSQATEDLLTFVVINSDIKTRGGFSSSHKVVNALQEITLQADFSNLHYFPTDCPHREKNGWTGDAALSAEQMLLNLNVQTTFREWMRNVCKAQNRAGAIPGIVPTAGWGIEWGSGPAWDRVIVYLPYYCYKYRGDTQIIAESAAAIKKYLNFLKGKTDTNGLVAFGLGDWCHPDREAENYKTPLVVTDSILSMDIASKAAFLFDVLDMREEREKAKKLANSYRDAIRKNLIDQSSMTIKGECQTSQAMGLFYGIFNADEEQAAFDRLLEFIKEHNDHIDFGVLGSRGIFRVLSKFSSSDLAFKMITRPDFPSYGNLLERGATALFEMFMKADTGYSLNHHFWGNISTWFIKDLAGINYNPDGTDLKNVVIAPHFPSQLNDAAAYFDSNFGRIEVSWIRDSDEIVLNLTVPQEIKGNIVLEKGYKFADGTYQKSVRSGKYVIRKLS